MFSVSGSPFFILRMKIQGPMIFRFKRSLETPVAIEASTGFR